jgi:hypothetical protein
VMVILNLELWIEFLFAIIRFFCLLICSKGDQFCLVSIVN